jgi:sulfonate transport system permease protein
VRNLALQRGIGGVLVFLLAWELAIRSGWLRSEALPAPSAIATAFAGLFTTAAVYGETLHTVGAALISWAVAAAIGIGLGAALGLSPALRSLTLTSVEVLRPLPPVALVPVALLLFGFSIKTELFVITIPSIWPILVATMGGVMAVPAKLKEVARSLRLNSRDVLCKILIPAAAASVLVGCRLSLSIALVLAIVVEMIGNPEGLGYAVVREAQALNREMMFAYVFLIGLLGIVFNQSLVALSRALLPGEFRRPLRVMGA